MSRKPGVFLSLRPKASRQRATPTDPTRDVLASKGVLDVGQAQENVTRVTGLRTRGIWCLLKQAVQERDASMRG